MKHRYLISRNQEDDLLTIKEFAILDKVSRNSVISDFNADDFSLLCKEVYQNGAIELAISKGKHDLISALRTPNMYPIRFYADAIADSVINLYTSQSDEVIELLFDDMELLIRPSDQDTLQ